jgi:zinc protease
MSNRSTARSRKSVFAFLLLTFAFGTMFAQTETPPAPSAPKTVSIPAVQEKKMPNGLTVAVVQRSSVPLVTVQLLVKSGASAESPEKAGLANLTADMLTKGTKTRSATQIAEDMEFLGGSIESGAGWNSSFVSVTVTPDKLDQAMAILADVVLNPAFKQDELDLLKSQTLDELKYNLKQPSFLANYVAGKYSFGEHPASGTPDSIQSITATDVSNFHDRYYRSNNSVLIFTGDVNLERATEATDRTFAAMKKWESTTGAASGMIGRNGAGANNSLVKRILVVDLPNSGQAAVGYYDRLENVSRKSEGFYPATVMNTVLGGGYSARLNYEIRIKRGLSYGAGSNIGWRSNISNFSTSAQTKNPSAAEVAELTLAEVKRLTESSVTNDELVPRKSTLTGNFGRSLETTNGLASAVGNLYSFGIPTSELNFYVSSVNAVTDAQIRDFAAKNILGGDLVIVGDYSVFKDDLAKRFPNVPIEVIKADELDLSKDNLKK